jgi:hypothetical protein
LAFSNGLKISPSFNPSIYHYTCSCDSLTAGADFSTVVRPHMVSPLSPALLLLQRASGLSRMCRLLISSCSLLCLLACSVLHSVRLWFLR